VGAVEAEAEGLPEGDALRLPPPPPGEGDPVAQGVAEGDAEAVAEGARGVAVAEAQEEGEAVARSVASLALALGDALPAAEAERESFADGVAVPEGECGDGVGEPEGAGVGVRGDDGDAAVVGEGEVVPAPPRMVALPLTVGVARARSTEDDEDALSVGVLGTDTHCVTELVGEPLELHVAREDAVLQPVGHSLTLGVTHAVWLTEEHVVGLILGVVETVGVWYVGLVEGLLLTVLEAEAVEEMEDVEDVERDLALVLECEGLVLTEAVLLEVWLAVAVFFDGVTKLDLETEGEAEVVGVAGTTRLMVCAPLSTT